nr:hypothetical protein [uncultured Holophaga sp.]
MAGLLGLVFAGIGLPLLVFQVRKGRRELWIKAHGQRITAQVKGVFLDQSLSVNGRHPFRIEAQWEAPGERKLYRFRSECLWFDPSDFVKETVEVVIDPQRPRSHWMDISFLPVLG